MKTKAKKVNVAQLRAHPLNPRLITPESVSSLKEDIKINGVKTPLQVLADGTILKGHRRLMACNELNITEIPVVEISEVSEEEIFGLLFDHSEKPLTKRELARAFRTVYSKTFSEARTAEKLYDVIAQVYGNVPENRMSKGIAEGKDSSTIMKEYYRGAVQLLAQLARLPEEWTDKYYNREAVSTDIRKVDKLRTKMLSENASVEEIEKALRDFGVKVKPETNKIHIRSKAEIKTAYHNTEGTIHATLAWILCESDELPTV